MKLIIFSHIYICKIISSISSLNNSVSVKDTAAVRVLGWRGVGLKYIKLWELKLGVCGAVNERNEKIQQLAHAVLELFS